MREKRERERDVAEGGEERTKREGMREKKETKKKGRQILAARLDWTARIKG